MPLQAASITAAAGSRQSTAIGPEIVWTLPKRILTGIGLKPDRRHSRIRA
jgi:hypothetical protein